MNSFVLSRKIYFCLSMILLATGSLLYIVFRPASLLLFRWVDFLGVMGPIEDLRSFFKIFEDRIPFVVVYSLPFAFWVTGYLFAIEAIWGDSSKRERHIWFWGVPLISLSSEFCQYFHLIPGVFDKFDILTIVLAILFVFIPSKINRRFKSKEFLC